MKTKNLYTYANNVCLGHTPNKYYDGKYRGLRIIVSDAAMRELMKEGQTLYDIVEILESGRDAPRKRKKNIIEKWLNKGNKTFNVVIAKDYNVIMKEECWVLIHSGKFTWGKK